MQQLKEKRVSQKSLESRSSKPKNQTENSESKATATTTAFLEDPTMVPTTRPKPNDQTETAESKATATTTAFAEDPTTTRPKPKDQTHRRVQGDCSDNGICGRSDDAPYNEAIAQGSNRDRRIQDDCNDNGIFGRSDDGSYNQAKASFQHQSEEKDLLHGGCTQIDQPKS
jgi:hypothetical protein